MPFDQMSFWGTWRKYQELALDAFDADLAHGNPKTHVVAPPGSGKTLIGMEIVRRRAEPALVLCPNAAIQAQWLAMARRFGAAEAEVAADPRAPICVLTYQALCQLSDPRDVLAGLARARWAEEKARATGLPPGELLAEARGYEGAAADRHRRELARITAQLKRAIARGEDLGAELMAILSPQARERVAALAERGPGQTVVLDECHHLASLWGYVVREMLLQISEPHVVGLTATAPEELSGEGADLYLDLLGEIDFVVPTPAVVRDGYLAPYQELCHLVEPLESELDWLREHDARFSELIAELHEDAESDLSFVRYVIERMRGRSHEGAEAAGIRFRDFQRRHPALARAGIRFLLSGGLAVPYDAPRGEAYRQPVDLDDWIVLLQDYALRRLATDPGQAAAERYERIARALRDLGFVLTRQGIRRGADEADRVVASSQAKVLGCARIVEVEGDARGPDMRCVILCDTEFERASPELALDLGRTSVRGLLAALADEPACAVLRPLAVSGKGVRCLPADADALAAALSAPGREVGARTEDGLCVLEAPGWKPREWIAAATAALTGGETRLLVGTRGLLGEGWDCPSVNCLIDLTVVAANVSSRQMRGRSLRLDPERPDKLASNWDVVCVAPGIAKGGSDYERFVRRHLHLHAPCEDGSIEVGPSHVHPALSPFHPPSGEEIAEVSAACRTRAVERDAARERWRIGEPYRGVETTALIVRARPGVKTFPVRAQPPAYGLQLSGPLSLAGTAALGGVAGALLLGPPAAAIAVLAVPALWRTAQAIEENSALYGPQAPLDLIAHAILDTYVELGEIRAEAAASLIDEPRPGGYVRLRVGPGRGGGAARRPALPAVAPGRAPRRPGARSPPPPRRRPIPTRHLGALALGAGRPRAAQAARARARAPLADLGRTAHAARLLRAAQRRSGRAQCGARAGR